MEYVFWNRQFLHRSGATVFNDFFVPLQTTENYEEQIPIMKQLHKNIIGRGGATINKVSYPKHSRLRAEYISVLFLVSFLALPLMINASLAKELIATNVIFLRYSIC